MRIVFICGSLKFGHDGVGDYTRRLASELIRYNQQAFIISLNDKFLAEDENAEDTQQEAGQTINVLRLSSQLPWTSRIRLANAFVSDINPDWISLQYVPFAFNDKGLQFNLISILKQVSSSRPMHIMFHELWLGMSVQSSMKHILWGKLQCYLIRSLLIALRPCVVHTHTPLYQIQLNRFGIDSLLLPLFSNIPVIGVADECANSEQPICRSEKRIKFVFFGGIFPGSPASEFASEVALYTNKKNVAIDLTIIGRNGPEQELWASAWRAHGLSVHILGEQSPASISEVLSHSSIGLSTTPVALSGKSGSIAAMHAHGLPALCVSAPWHPRNVPPLTVAPGILEYTIGNFEQAMKCRGNMNLPSIDVTAVAHQLLTSLSTVASQVTSTPAC